MKKVFEIFKWSMLLSVIVLLMDFSIKNQKKVQCQQFEVVLTTSENHFINDKMINDLLKSKNLHPLEKVREEIEFLHKKYNLELIYMIDDTFLALSEKRFDELYEMYSDYKIPFWMNTRCETMTERRAQKLEEMNMLRMNFGIEHGNPEYRRNVLKRPTTNERMIEAFRMTSGKKYSVAGDLMIGMPDENRDLIFDTINFMRKLPNNVDATGAFIWAPYHGTPLGELAIEKGYIDKDVIASISNTAYSMLNMPSISKEEITGLAKTFSYYVKFPKDRWGDIRKAEESNAAGLEMHSKLGKEFDEKYRFGAHAMPDLH